MCQCDTDLTHTTPIPFPVLHVTFCTHKTVEADYFIHTRGPTPPHPRHQCTTLTLVMFHRSLGSSGYKRGRTLGTCIHSKEAHRPHWVELINFATTVHNTTQLGTSFFPTMFSLPIRIKVEFLLHIKN